MDTTLITDAEMLTKVEAFCERHNLAPSTFGRLAIGDGNLVTNLRAGRSPTLKMANRIVDFMATYSLDAPAAEAA